MNQRVFTDSTVTPQPLRELLDLTCVVANRLIGQPHVSAPAGYRSQFSEGELNGGNTEMTDLRRPRHLDQPQDVIPAGIDVDSIPTPGGQPSMPVMDVVSQGLPLGFRPSDFPRVRHARSDRMDSGFQPVGDPLGHRPVRAGLRLDLFSVGVSVSDVQ